jgi:predicted SprT family Zn-dependent metalloprotease
MTKHEIKMLYFKAYDKLKNYIIFMPTIGFFNPIFFKYANTQHIAGQYFTLINVIKINKKHWIHQNEARILDTIIHELAHAYMHQLGLKCDHGRYFVQMYKRFSEIIGDEQQLQLVSEHVLRYTETTENKKGQI